MTMGRNCSNIVAHSTRFATPVSSSRVMKMALPLPGRWRTRTTPAVRTRVPLRLSFRSPQVSIRS